MKDTRVNVAAENSWAIKWASASGDVRMVDRLLQEPRVDPSADNNLAIQSAFDEQHTSIVSLLLQDDRVGKSLTGPIRLAIISGPDMYSTGFINFICEKDGIPSNNFLCRLLVAVFTRQLNMNDARTEMWPHYMQNRYARSMAGQFRQLWEHGDFATALKLIQDLWHEWKWMIHQRKSEWRYHPSRVRDEMLSW